jgi:arylsulfatase A-like enzyme/Tfp pilus assembly protein PilF
MLTGLYPFEHGVRNNGNFYLGDRVETLATALKGKGYRTAAFVSAFVLDRRYGLARGFDVYDDRMDGARPHVLSFEAERRGDRTALALSAWLDASSRDASSPFFAWLHLYDPHEPYSPPSPFREAFADAPYDGEIAFDDNIVASILDRLGQLGLRDDTLIVVAGDHGESLGDHGEETHTMFVYEAAIRVPMIFWRPGRLPGGVVVHDPVRLTDITPTVLDLLGLPAIAAKDGRSLVTLMNGGNGTGPAVYAETLVPQLYMNWAPLRTVREDRWKLIQAPRPELYDLATDPGEQQNVYAARQQTARSLEQQLARITGGSAGAMNTGAIDREALDKLASLGYIGATGAPSASTTLGETLPDPRDFIAMANRLRHAEKAVLEGRPAEALPTLREAIAKDPRNAFAQLALGNAYMAQGENRRAIDQYQRYEQLVPSNALAYQFAAVCYLRLGDRENALRQAQAALAIDPKFSDARVLRAGVFAARGEYGEAIKELQAAVAADPTKPMVRLDLAKVLAESGRTAEARREYDTILQQEPDYAPALTGAGVLEAQAGNLAKGAGLLERALEIDPAQHQARYNLGGVLERQGRTAEAVAEYRRVAATANAPADIRRAAEQRLHALGR